MEQAQLGNIMRKNKGMEDCPRVLCLVPAERVAVQEWDIERWCTHFHTLFLISLFREQNGIHVPHKL